jgi:hypothetical protein
MDDIGDIRTVSYTGETEPEEHYVTRPYCGRFYRFIDSKSCTKECFREVKNPLRPELIGQCQDLIMRKVRRE